MPGCFFCISVHFEFESISYGKNPAYGRHQFSWSMRIEGPIQILRGCVRYVNYFIFLFFFERLCDLFYFLLFFFCLIFLKKKKIEGWGSHLSIQIWRGCVHYLNIFIFFEREMFCDIYFFFERLCDLSHFFCWKKRVRLLDFSQKKN